MRSALTKFWSTTDSFFRHLFNKERVIVTSPKGLGEVLTQKSYDFVKPYMLVAMVGKILGIGLLLAEGDEHKRQRKNLMPAFSFRHIKDLYPVFWSKAQEMVSGIEKELNQSAVKIVDMSDWASRASLDIIGLAGMGHDFGALADPSIEDTMKMYGGKVKQSRTGKLLTMLQLFFPIWLVDILPFDRNKGVHAVSRAARNTSRKLIKQKQEQIASGKPLSPDIISTALESGTFMEEGLVDSMMTFLAAGHETSAAAFTWTVYLLGQHREEQSRLRKEIKSGISSVTDTIDSNQLDGLPYLHAVCQESLRMYAPIPFTVRDANKDTSILGQFIPRGTMIIIGPWAINWSKDLWGPDAHTFNPERWMGAGRANSGGAVSNYANLTFLHGPRSCIGQKFSVAELASLVAAFVGRFEFELAYPDEKIDITDGIVAKPVNGMKVKVKAVEER